MAINPSQKSKNQSLGLSGSNLYSWQSKPMQGRQPSGANAPRMDVYKTPGVANRAGVPKAPTTDTMQAGVAANPSINLQEMFYGPNSRSNALAAQDAAMAPKPAPSQPQPQPQSQSPMATAPASPTPMAPYQQTTQPAQPSGQMNEVAKSVDDMAMLQANVPAEFVQKYKENLMSGKTQMTPQEAMAYYQAYYQAPAVAQGAAQGLRAQGDAKLAAAQEYATGVDQLKDVGVKNYGDYNYKTNLQNQTTEARNASLEAELKRQEAGGGLKATNQQLSNLYGVRDAELASRDAAAFNAMSAADQEKKDAFNKKYDEDFAKYQAIRTPAPEVGVEPPVYKPKQRTQAQEEGLARRREQASAQAAYRSDAARLMGQGMSPQQAHQALARDQAMQNFYDANVAMQSAEAQGQVGAAGLQAQADMYRSNMQFLDNTADRKEKSAQRLYDQKQAENEAMMQIEQQASQLPGDPRDPNTPAGRYAATQRALRLGVQPPNPIQAAKDTPADQRTSSQTNSLVDMSIEQLKAGQGFDPNSNTAIITGVRKFKEAGLSPQEQIKGISKLTGQDMSIKSNSTKAIRAIMEDISTRATANSQNSLTGKDYAREYATGAADYTESLRALKEGSGMSDQEFAAILKENPIGQYLNQQQGRGLTGAAFGPFLGPIIDSYL